MIIKAGDVLTAANMTFVVLIVKVDEVNDLVTCLWLRDSPRDPVRDGSLGRFSVVAFNGWERL